MTFYWLSAAWDFLSRNADTIAAFAAAAGLFLTAREFRINRKKSDLDAISSFFETVTTRERNLFEVNEDRTLDADVKAERMTRLLNDLFNTLEIYALAHNRKLVGRASRHLISHKLIGTIAHFESNEEILIRMKMAKDSPTTFKELDIFRENYRPSINLQICTLREASASQAKDATA